MNKRMLLLICLTASLFAGCKTTPKDFPKAPSFTLKQTIIDQQFCDGNGLCIKKSLCREYALNSSGKWYFVADHELKFCHGIMGVNSSELVEIKDFLRLGWDWVKAHAR